MFPGNNKIAIAFESYIYIYIYARKIQTNKWNGTDLKELLKRNTTVVVFMVCINHLIAQEVTHFLYLFRHQRFYKAIGRSMSETAVSEKVATFKWEQSQKVYIDVIYGFRLTSSSNASIISINSFNNRMVLQVFIWK